MKAFRVCSRESGVFQEMFSRTDRYKFYMSSWSRLLGLLNGPWPWHVLCMSSGIHLLPGDLIYPLKDDSMGLGFRM